MLPSTSTVLILLLIKFSHAYQRKILIIFPESNDENASWIQESIQMFRIAIDMWKMDDDSNQLADLDYDIVNLTIGSNIVAQLTKICEIIERDNVSQIVGIIGGTSLTSTVLLNSWAASLDIPLISSTASNTEFDDHHRYPSFFRTVPSDSWLIEAIVDLFKIYNWRKVIIIDDVNDPKHDVLKILTDQQQQNIIVVNHLTYDSNSEDFHDDFGKVLKASKSRIVLIWANKIACTKILGKLLDETVIPNEFNWLTTHQVSLLYLIINHNFLNQFTLDRNKSDVTRFTSVKKYFNN